jgi:hypothetical protein
MKAHSLCVAAGYDVSAARAILSWILSTQKTVLNSCEKTNQLKTKHFGHMVNLSHENKFRRNLSA